MKIVCFFFFQAEDGIRSPLVTGVQTCALPISGFAPAYAERAPRNWAREEITWGIWNIPESRVAALGEVAGLDVVELGCGTAYFSAWLARRGARPVGIDPTPAQLATAKAMQDR